MYLLETKAIKLTENICIHSDIIFLNNAPFFHIRVVALCRTLQSFEKFVNIRIYPVY